MNEQSQQKSPGADAPDEVYAYLSSMYGKLFHDRMFVGERLRLVLEELCGIVRDVMANLDEPKTDASPTEQEDQTQNIKQQ